MLALKDNQPKLHQAIQEYFAETREDELCSMPYRCHETDETGHGRLDDRYYYLAKLPKDIAFKKQWHQGDRHGDPNHGKNDGTTSGDVCYIIVSHYLGGVNVSKCDGSVDFYSDDIGEFLWRALVAAHGQELVAEGS